MEVLHTTVKKIARTVKSLAQVLVGSAQGRFNPLSSYLLTILMGGTWKAECSAAHGKLNAVGAELMLWHKSG